MLFLSILFISMLHSLNFFYNGYVIYKRDYNERMVRAHGFCDKDGYGFTKYIIKKYNFHKNTPLIIHSDFSPGVKSLLFDLKKITNLNFLIILNFEETNENKFKNKIIFFNKKKINLNTYSLQEKFGNCYLYKKND
jgi:hypothetical protein